MRNLQPPLSRRRLLQAAAVGVPLLGLPTLLAGCGADSQAGTGRRIRVSQSVDPTTLDPQKQGGMTTMNVLINLFDTLTARDVHNELVPRLATSWTAVDDHHWRFVLRRGVTFHNGERFDAQTVKFSIERLLDPKTQSPIVELRYVTGVRVVDRYTVDFVLDQPDPVLPAKLSLFGGVMVPPKYLADAGDEKFAAAPVGTGPFRFESWKRGVSIRMRAYEQHWESRPGYDELEIQTIQNPASALAALQSDEVDLVTGLVPDAALQLEGYKGVRVSSFPGLRMSYLSLDTTDPAFSDVRVRRALNHAMDVPLLVKATLNGHGREVPTMIPRESFGFDPAIAPYSRDLDQARRLLAQAGHPDGLSTTLTASSTDATTAQAISGLLTKVGVQAKVSLLDPSTYSQRLTSDNRKALGPMYLASTTGWTLDGSSPVQSNVRTGRRQSRWTNPLADQLIDREENSIRPADRQKAFSSLQRLLSQEAPFVFLYQADTIVISNDRVRWTPNVIGHLALQSAVRDD
ncbi:ABC transporter substrate-binding protein [Kribbella italica]|uniref:Peptide/nickel transport system substrate-binding protein n=1 Tax=Kribbella italica TaxID=1540520 RepID=A0A7W9JG41_9ACTN|nr:ABC transporter substrate-binding protein [Kribbella italica]MBB5840868.1 peptide/nickel transport system substrate-binding protein [Kribbella italica]